MNVIDRVKSHLGDLERIKSDEVLISLKCTTFNRETIGKVAKIIEIMEFITSYIKDHKVPPKVCDVPHAKSFSNNGWGFSYAALLKVMGCKKSIKCLDCGKITESLRSDKKRCNACVTERRLTSKATPVDSEYHSNFNFGSKS